MSLDKERVKRQINQLEFARKLIVTAFEDLKNIQEFREGAGNLGNREAILTLLDDTINAARGTL